VGISYLNLVIKNVSSKRRTAARNHRLWYSWRN